MTVGSKEFDEMRAQFEEWTKKMPGQTIRIDREDKDSPKGIFYQNGRTNELFHAYMMGYQNAKCVYQ